MVSVEGISFPEGMGKRGGEIGMPARRRVCRWIYIRGIRGNKAGARDCRVAFTTKCVPLSEPNAANVQHSAENTSLG